MLDSESVQHYRKAGLIRRRTFLLLLLLTSSGILSLFYFASDLLSSSFSSVSSSLRPGGNHRLSSNSTPSTSTSDVTNNSPFPSNVLLVSAFFPSPTSKHTQAEYNKSLSQFLSRITTDVYIFTTLDFEAQIKEIRGDLPIWIDTTFQSPLEIPPLAEFQDQYHNMRKNHGSVPTGSPHVYAMRTAKVYFLKQGLYELQGQSFPADKKYKYAFWIDFDSFPVAGHTFKNWPDPFRVEKVWNDGSQLTGLAEENLIFIPLKGLPNLSMTMWWEDMGPIDNQFSQYPRLKETLTFPIATCFGGMTNAIDWLYEAYFVYHNHWLQRGKFVGKDESVFNAIIMLHPSRILGLWLFDPIASKALAILSSLQFSSYTPQEPPPKEMLSTPLGECHDHNIYHIYFLGGDKERNEMALSWLNRWRWMWPWEWIRQVSIKKEPCSLTQVLPMQPTLSNKAFNGNWLPPSSNIYPEEQ